MSKFNQKDKTMITRNTDLIVDLVEFGDKDLNLGLEMDYESFVEAVIDNPEFRDKLEKGLVKGLFTHTGRDDADIEMVRPYDDIIAIHSDLANVIRDVWIVNDPVSGNKVARASVDILDGFGGGEKAKNHLKNNLYLGVSMATISSIDPVTNKYIIEELKGVDFTTNPAFKKSSISKVNFDSGNSKKFNFSFIVKDYKYQRYVNFSFKRHLRDRRKPDQLVLRGRINEVIRTLKNMSPEDISFRKHDIKIYLDDIIYNWITKAMESPKKVNISMGMRLNKYLSNGSKDAVEFNRNINKVKRVYRNLGYVDKVHQKILNKAIRDLFKSFWYNISEKAGIDPNLLVESGDSPVDNMRSGLE